MNRPLQLGEATVHKIVEMVYPFAPALDFLPGLTPAQLQENQNWLAPGAYDPASGQLILSFHSYIIRTPQHVILVDSCVGDDKQRARPEWDRKRDGNFLRALHAAGFRLEDIDYVLCSHLHSDHVGWNTRLQDGRWVPTFPNARYLFAKEEYDYWLARHQTQPNVVFEDSVLPIVAASRAEMVAGDHQINDLVRLSPTPGHTPHHSAILLGRSAQATAAFTGDLIHSPIQLRYPEISQRADHDRALSARTRMRFLQQCCEGGAVLCSGHFPSPSAGRLQPWGGGFRLCPLE